MVVVKAHVHKKENIHLLNAQVAKQKLFLVNQMRNLFLRLM
jgi:hypothetical protein